ncbi:DNA-dependent ATPase protein rad54 [Gryganskiella cystojenkinii]|nr:DNA-dependent ATPase protein rad54 [Gryganskiella cystojenkinii]
MKRGHSAISLKRPASKIPLPSSQEQQAQPAQTPAQPQSQPCPTTPPSSDNLSRSVSAPSPSSVATKTSPSSLTTSNVLGTVSVEIPARKTILKKNPGSKSPIPKKVEFVDDSEDGSLSDPDYDEDDDMFQNRGGSQEEEVNLVKVPQIPSLTTQKPVVATSKSPSLPSVPVLASKPSTAKSKSLVTSPRSKPVPKITRVEASDGDEDDEEEEAKQEVTPPSPPSPPSVGAAKPKVTAKTITLVKPKPVPRITKVELSDDNEEDDYDENDGDDESDYDSDGVSRKRVKTSRVTHQSIKASLPAATTRTSRSGRAPLTTLKVTISSKPLPTTKSAASGGKAIATLGKKFKVPTFTKPGMAPEPTRQGAGQLGVKRRPAVEGKSAHDYTQEGSIILYDPAWAVLDEAQKEEEKLMSASQEQSKGSDDENSPPQVIIPKKEKAKSKSIAEILGLTKTKEVPKVHVVVDPVLARVLRPHQVEGVKFMYKCATGAMQSDAFGCIMADEMGLGKTLQCIALLWTLLKQSPDPGKGTIEKCIICCPSSLVRNWANEIVKWLGPGKIGVLSCDAKGTKEDTNNAMRRWASARQRMVVNPVLIISYESLRMYAPILAQTPIGLMLCDEGHRLKNSGSQTFVALNELNVQRRVILSGTPIQNDLSEYFSLLNFANPGLLGSTAEFRKNYELPILRGRDSEATDQEQEISNQKLTELSGVVSKFIIRRTNDILSKYLPTKFEHVVFCKLSQFQLDLYNHFINSKSIQRLLRGNGSQPLKAIGLLKKLCNHPDLLDLPDDLEGCESLLPPEYQIKDARKSMSRGGVMVQTEFSGKMQVLDRMLAKIKKETTDKIVLISNYTQTLDIFEKLCRQKQYGVLRLDGTMTINKRQKLVDRFNNPEGHEFVFLLSSKAGGCGLNLIGANRLILFDPDWNPAADQQALARVWRDGQKKDCFVYRFIATGSIEEKIFQRQSHKQSLSSCVVDEDQDVERHFSQENLRQLFQFNATTECCDTHETFKCKRCVQGRQMVKAPSVSYGDTSTWNHFRGDQDLLKLPDPLLKAEAETGAVSFVFQYISH